MDSTEGEQIATNAEAISGLKDSDSAQWEAIRTLQTRLPLWATVILMIMSALVGSALTYAAVVVRLAAS